MQAKINRCFCVCPFEGGCPLLGGSVKRGSTVGGLGEGGGGGILVCGIGFTLFCFNQSSEIMSLFLSPALSFNFFGKKNEEKAIKSFVACYVISVDYQNFINTSTNLVV